MKTQKLITGFLGLWLACFSWTSCNQQAKHPTDTTTSGTIHISVDISYEPLMDSEIKVFETQHPQAHIIASYKPEADCFKDLLNDSARLIIVTRDLNEQEKAYFKSIKEPIVSKILAWDAVAVIVNPSNPDTNMTVDELAKITTGEYHGKPVQLVFDEQNSSTVRFIIDSINHGKPLPGYAMAANGPSQVVDYVASTPNAIGLIGVSWVSDPYDTLALSFLKKVRVVGLKTASETRYFKPYQYYIALKSYPLTRAFYFILREPYYGLGTGFVNFLASDKGQLIIAKYRLFPALMNIVFRDATIQ
ncbi:phosphate ABC transporter substrate-binding protein (PhoT family) [Thermoflavifilum aggregans]|uniref:Phosphate ABC transporter substrate-binding protein (PhoT family) n=1 Tax=Thermoflavifilum aggregans TaxID=454188 RepID=A0A2M9CTB2_9BACT|nr:substrate-binding domain-containing protein [Thermoflavifilum aggregans]PJJ75160.1 phosphate ABC transporter substrate-binding protein (PhoT family) [Thermoflavifilum aggregans]